MNSQQKSILEASHLTPKKKSATMGLSAVGFELIRLVEILLEDPDDWTDHQTSVKVLSLIERLKLCKEEFTPPKRTFWQHQDEFPF